MKELVQLGKTVDVNDSIGVKAFRMDYIYLNDDGFTIHFMPNAIPPFRAKYADMPVETVEKVQATFALLAGLSVTELTKPAPSPDTPTPELED